MAFVAEDGTGLATANAYVSVAYGNTHHADRGRTDWASASDGDKEKALIRATDYIDQRFGIKFIGDRQSSAQALQWPRMGAYDRDGHALLGVPPQLQKACSEYALISLRQGELAPNPQLPVPDAVVATGESEEGPVPKGEITKEVVGPLETQWQPLSHARSPAATNKAPQSSMLSDFHIPEYPVADLWIEELLVNPTSRVLVRA